MNEPQTEIERKLAEQQRIATEQLPDAVLASDAAEVPPAAKAPKQRGILGWLVGAGVIIMKTISPILLVLGKLKFIMITFGSLVISAWAYSTRFGWAFAVGFVLLLLVHESGHAIASRIKGYATGPMVFIPFFGAFVAGAGGRSVEEDAFIGIMGPVFGTIASVVCVILFFLTSYQLFLGLAYFGFLLNLFNLFPTPPLDGGWIAPLFSPKLLAVGVVAGIACALLFRVNNPMIYVFGLLSLPRIIGGWKANPEIQPYYQVTSAAKWKYGLLYLGLVLFLVAGMYVFSLRMGA
jgi:Zn-dependent protease